MSVKIPGKAVAISPPAGEDISAPTRALLQDLNLLAPDAELKEARGLVAAFRGPPDSVAVLEAGATAASKGWSAFIAAGAAVWVGQAVVLWDEIGRDNRWNQPVTILSIAIVLAVAAGSIGYLLGSDVRGRAAATVATVEARRAVAETMIRAAEASFSPDVSAADPGPISLPGVIDVKNGLRTGVAEDGWKAVAARERDDSIEFLLVKESEAVWVPSPNVRFS